MVERVWRTARRLTRVMLLIAAGATSIAYAQPAVRADPQRMLEDTRILASDDFEGRGVATRGEARTIAFLVDRFKRLGLVPAGPGGKWTQKVALNRMEPKRPIRLELNTKNGARQLSQGTEMVVATARPTESVGIRDAPIVFAGYGIHAPERGWDDYAGFDARGKIVMVLVNDPDFETAQPGAFDGRAVTYFGRWIYKIEEAARQGALGVLIVHETEPAGYGWEVPVATLTAPQFDIMSQNERPRRPELQGWIRRDSAAALLQEAGLDLDRLKVQAQTPGFRPVALPGTTLSAHFSVSTRQIESHNVLGRRPGRSAPDEAVIYTAHWDHVGLGRPDAKGDAIYNGALDNAIGVAGLLELARLHAADPQPDRSVLFIATTAEESGLLGAEHYAAAPALPLEKTAAVLNLDILIPNGPSRDLVVIGSGKTDIEPLLAEEAGKQNMRLTPDENAGTGSFYRSDHFPFAKRGVPVIAIMDMSSPHDMEVGGRAAGAVWLDRYKSAHYHRPSDQWDSSWDLRGAASKIDIFHRLARRLSRTCQWPQWAPQAEFKALRDASENERRC